MAATPRGNRPALLVLAALVAVIVVPVVVRQVRSVEPRHLEGVSLDQTSPQEVAFRNDAQAVDLAGLMFLPEGSGPSPAVVVIHGSGSSSRENRWYLTFVKYLQDNGIVVLLPDKRGSGKSGGRWQEASFPDLASDTVAAIRFLQSGVGVPLSSIGVVGVSQGGNIAPLVAEAVPELDFVVNLVGAAVPLEEALWFEESNNLQQLGFLPLVADLIAYPSAWSLVNLRQRGFWDAVGNFDALPHWRKVDAPTLIMYGSDDTNTPTAESVRRLETLGNPHLEWRIYPGSGHPLESPEGQGDRMFRDDALRDLGEFILKHG